MTTDIKTALAKLSDFDHGELKKQWCTLYGREPPRGMSRQLLRHSLAYRLQEQALGGLRSATRRYLERLVADDKAVQATSTVKPGTRLLREWHDVTYEVIVLDQGVIFKGKRFRSLSEVAREITGAKWSGPAFFGLRRKACG